MKNQQGPSLAPNQFIHWALMIEFDSFQMILHIKELNGKREFEYFSFSPSVPIKILSKEFIGITQLNVSSVIKSCRDTFNFDTDHNCENWITQVLKHLESSLIPQATSDECGYLYLIVLSSNSSEALFEPKMTSVDFPTCVVI